MNKLTMAQVVESESIGLTVMVWEPTSLPGVTIEDQINLWFNSLGMITVKFEDGSYIWVHEAEYDSFIKELPKHIYEINSMAFAS